MNDLNTIEGQNTHSQDTQIQDTQVQGDDYQSDFSDFITDDTPQADVPQETQTDVEPNQNINSFYTYEELQQILESGQEPDPKRLSPEAKLLYEEFKSNTSFMNKSQEPQNIPQNQLPEDLNVEIQIAKESAELADQKFQEIFGEPYDKLTATPEQEKIFKIFMDQAENTLRKQLEQQQEIARMYQNDAQFVHYYAQKLGKPAEEAYKELYAVMGPAIEAINKYQDAMKNGDFEAAYKLIESLKAKQANMQTLKPQTPVNNTETSSAPEIPTQTQKDELQELMEFLS